MNVYATFNEAGFVLRFHHLEDEEPAPEGGVVLTEEQFADLAEFQGLRRWNGTEIEVYEPPKPKVRSVSAAQAKTALFNAGILDDVEELVKNHPYRPVRIFFESANTWETGNAYVQAIGVDLELITFDADGVENADAFDALFEAAARL